MFYKKHVTVTHQIWQKVISHNMFLRRSNEYIPRGIKIMKENAQKYCKTRK